MTIKHKALYCIEPCGNIMLMQSFEQRKNITNFRMARVRRVTEVIEIKDLKTI